jgi:SEC-C motif
MAKIGRNEACSCGSGLKAKRCCLAEGGALISTPRATLARLKMAVVGDLVGISRTRFRELYDEVIDLPDLDVSLHVRLPGILTPEIEEAMFAFSDKGEDDFDRALQGVLVTLDTFERRLELAEAVLRLRDEGRVPPAIAGIAIFDLNNADSALLTSALAQAIAVKSGKEATPSGLILAS